MYRIREDLLPLNDTSIDYFVRRDQTDLSTTLRAVLKHITGASVDVDLERDLIAIENLREHSEKELSLCFSNSTLATEWNYEKNEKLRPEHVTANSRKKVWWICNEGHEWQATIASRNSTFSRTAIHDSPTIVITLDTICLTIPRIPVNPVALFAI